MPIRSYFENNCSHNHIQIDQIDQDVLASQEYPRFVLTVNEASRHLLSETIGFTLIPGLPPIDGLTPYDRTKQHQK